MKFLSKFKPETIVANSAFVLSFIAIAVSAYEVSILNDQRNASVWPRLFIAKNTGTDKLELIVTNAGIGPAQIKFIDLAVDGKSIKDWDDYADTLIPKPITDLKGESTSSTLSSRIIMSGETVKPLTVKGELARSMLGALKNKKSAFKICYCSLYAQCWTIDEISHTGPGFAAPYEVDQCPGMHTQIFNR